MPDLIWPDFYKRTKDHPHWSLLEKAALLLAHKGHALDLGCGAGRDTRYLLSQGWQVTAVDSDPTAIAILRELSQEYLQVVQSSFEDFVYAHEAYDLVSSQFSLPFNHRASFTNLFTRIKQSIKPGGIFTGQFFGVHDESNTPERNMTFLSRQQVNELLSDMTVIELTEEDKIGPTASGTLKHWHVFHVIAQKATV